MRSISPRIRSKEDRHAGEEGEPITQWTWNEPAWRRLWPRRQEAQSAQAEARTEEVAPTAAATLRRGALVGDLELQTGMDHVRVVADRVLVRGIELGPALRVAHLGLRDV